MYTTFCLSSGPSLERTVEWVGTAEERSSDPCWGGKQSRDAAQVQVGDAIKLTSKRKLGMETQPGTI